MIATTVSIMLISVNPCPRGFIIKIPNKNYFIAGRLEGGTNTYIMKYNTNMDYSSPSINLGSSIELNNSPRRKWSCGDEYNDKFVIFGERLTIGDHTNMTKIKQTNTYSGTNFKYVICIDASTCIAADDDDNNLYYHHITSTDFLGNDDNHTRIQLSNYSNTVTGLAGWNNIGVFFISTAARGRFCAIGRSTCFVWQQDNDAAHAAWDGTRFIIGMSNGGSTMFYLSQPVNNAIVAADLVFTVNHPNISRILLSSQGEFAFMTHLNNATISVYEKKPCHTSCATCSGPNDTPCLTCLTTTMIKDAVTGQCSECTGIGEVKYLNGTCGKCAPFCATCNTSNNQICYTCQTPATYKLLPSKLCGSCGAGFYSDVTKCYQCDSSCIACSINSTHCSACVSTHCLNGDTCTDMAIVPSTWYMDTGTSPYTCAPCPINCATCNPTACLTCMSGYYLIGGACSYCPTACSECTSPSHCTACKSTYSLFPDYTCAACPTAGGMFVLGSNCLNCSPSCATCSNAIGCLTCPTGTSLLASGLCGQCPLNSYSSGDGICHACDTQCNTCNGPGPNKCTSCRTADSTPHYLKVDTCAKCDLSTEVIIANTNCSNCAPPCTTCFGSPSSCTSCTLPNVLSGGTCVPCGGSNFIDASDSNKCNPCSSNCQTCQNTSTHCLTCAGGKYLFADDNFCTACTTPGLFVNTTDAKCHRCDSNCSTCVDPGTHCLSCVNDQYLVNSAYSNCDPCIRDTTGLVAGKCNICDINCRLCNGTITNCTACYNNWTIMTADNNKCGNNCNATGGSYIETVSGVSYCKQCDSSCEMCEGTSDYCTKCTYPKILSDHQCRDCPFGCLMCTSPTVCTSCESSYFITANGTCRTTCNSPGLFAAGRECRVCSANCKSCFGSAASCTSCIAGQYLSATNTCVPCTENGYYHNSTNCLQCDSSCLTCNGSTSTDCLTCRAELTLSDDQSCQLVPPLKLVSSTFKSDIEIATFLFDSALANMQQAPYVTVVKCSREELRPLLATVLSLPTENSMCPPLTGWTLRSLDVEGASVKVKLTVSKSLEEVTIVVVAPEKDYWRAEVNKLIRYPEDYLIVENVTVIKSALDGMMDSAAAPAAGAMTAVQTLVMTVSAPQAFVLMKMMQTLDYYIYIDCNYPSNFAKFLDMITNSAIEMLPNFLEPLVDNDGLPLYERFAEYGMKVHIFANLGQIYSAAALMAGAKLLLFLVGKVFKSRRKLHSILGIDFFFGLFESYNLDSVLSILIFIANREQINHRQDAVKYLVIVFVSLFSLFMISMYLFMGYTVSRLTDSYFKHAVVEIKNMKNEGWKFLLEDKNMHGNIFQRHFNLIQLFKDIVFAALLYALYYKPLVLIILLTLIQAGFTVSVWVYPPYRIGWMNWSLKISQILYLSLDCFFICLLGITLDEKTRYYLLGFTMIGNVLMILTCNIGFTLYSTVIELALKWRKYKKSRLQITKVSNSESVFNTPTDLHKSPSQEDISASPSLLAKIKRKKRPLINTSIISRNTNNQVSQDNSTVDNDLLNESSRGHSASKKSESTGTKVTKGSAQLSLRKKLSTSISINKTKITPNKGLIKGNTLKEISPGLTEKYESKNVNPRETVVHFVYSNKKASRNVLKKSTLANDSSQN